MANDQADPENQRSLPGRRGRLAAALVLMAGVGLGFVAWLVQGPRIQTQYSVANESGHLVQIDALRLDGSSISIDKPLETRRGQKSIYYRVTGFVDIIPHSFEIEISYRYLDTGDRHSGTFVVKKIKEQEMCWFALILSPEGPKVTECMRSEALDFSSY